MNVNNGELLGLGSSPSYDPPCSPSRPAEPGAGEADLRRPRRARQRVSAPALNRADQGAYPTGSIFKPITALAALESGELGLNEIILDDGAFDAGDGRQEAERRRRGQRPDRPPRRPARLLRRLLLRARARTNSDSGDGGADQEWSRELGLGEPTGIDVGNESDGLVPDPDGATSSTRARRSPQSPGGRGRGRRRLLRVRRRRSPWSVGDNVNLAVGQGDLQANPLQMAVAYAAIANGGEIVRPHVGLRVEDQPRPHDPGDRARAAAHVDIEPGWQRAIMEGLHQAATAPDGTSYNVFGGYPVEIAGKTGTAETSRGATSPGTSPSLPMTIRSTSSR